jgi:hypothetical protein
MLGFKSYRTAAVTLAGIEFAHRIRKRQFKFGPGRWICWSLKKQWIRPWRELGGLWDLGRTSQDPVTHQIRSAIRTLSGSSPSCHLLLRRYSLLRLHF